MRPLTYYVAASLDGCIARADGGLDWLPPNDDPACDYGYAALLRSVDLLVMGRRTWETTRTFGAWPYPDHASVVFSRTLAAAATPRTTLVATDPAGWLARAKDGPGGGIWLVGGAGLAAPLLAAGLVDRLIVTWVPVVLGGGIPLFPPAAGPSRWRTRSAVPYPSGLVQVTLERAA